MGTKQIISALLTVCIAALAIFGLIRLLTHLPHTQNVPVAYLYKHELVTPSNSGMYPEIIKSKLSEEALRERIKVDVDQNRTADQVLEDVHEYLTANITRTISEDPLVQYTHYYHMVITNESDNLMEDLYVTFPNVEAVELRRGKSEPEVLASDNNRYIIGDIEPGELVDVYAWNSRPFLFQEEDNIILRYSGGSAIVKLVEVKPRESWIKDNLILVIILGSLILLLSQKMVMVIRSCVMTVEPKLKKRITLE